MNCMRDWTQRKMKGKSIDCLWLKKNYSDTFRTNAIVKIKIRKN